MTKKIITPVPVGRKGNPKWYITTINAFTARKASSLGIFFFRKLSDSAAGIPGLLIWPSGARYGLDGSDASRWWGCHTGFLGGSIAAVASVACCIGMGAQDASLRSRIAQVVSINKRGSAFGASNGVYDVTWFLGSATMGLLYSHSLMALVVFGMMAQPAAILFFRLRTPPALAAAAAQGVWRDSLDSMTWLVWSLLSAVFAALTAILAKKGVAGVDATLATAVRTSVVVVFAWLLALVTGTPHRFQPFTTRTWLFLALSGVATGLSWLCYFHALQVGEASRVAPIDKLSVVFVIILATVFLGEKLTWGKGIGVLLIAAGAITIAID